MQKLEDLIASAYTFLEFGKSFANYQSDLINLQDGLTREQLRGDWDMIRADYNLVKKYMTDTALQHAYSLVKDHY